MIEGIIAGDTEIAFETCYQHWTWTDRKSGVLMVRDVNETRDITPASLISREKKSSVALKWVPDEIFTGTSSGRTYATIGCTGTDYIELFSPKTVNGSQSTLIGVDSVTRVLFARAVPSAIPANTVLSSEQEVADKLWPRAVYNYNGSHFKKLRHKTEPLSSGHF